MLPFNEPAIIVTPISSKKFTVNSDKKLTFGEGLFIVDRLGGFLNRKMVGDPGMKSIRKRVVVLG